MQQKPNVIITTAYPEYAVEGFELSVIDYLLKPFSLERFLQAVLKVQQKSTEQGKTIFVDRTEAATSIFVKSDKKSIKINFDDIFHIEAYGNYIKIGTDKMILTPKTLSDFAEKLPSNFLQIHKSFIINFDKIKLIEGNLITLNNDVKVPIGKSFRKSVLARI